MAPDTSNRSDRWLLTPSNIAAAVLVALAVIYILQDRAATTIQLFWVSRAITTRRAPVGVVGDH